MKNIVPIATHFKNFQRMKRDWIRGEAEVAFRVRRLYQFFFLNPFLFKRLDIP